MDAHRDKLAMIVGQTKLTMVAMVDMYDCKIFPGPEFGTKFQSKAPLFLETPKFPSSTAWDKPFYKSDTLTAVKKTWNIDTEYWYQPVKMTFWPHFFSIVAFMSALLSPFTAYSQIAPLLVLDNDLTNV